MKPANIITPTAIATNTIAAGLLITATASTMPYTANATTSFIGDFDLKYLLFPNGNLAINVYNKTNDRYFTRNSLNTQGLGVIMKKDFTRISDLFFWRKKEKTKK